MAITYHTVTGKLLIPGTTIGIKAEVTFLPMTVNNALTFTADNTSTFGPVRAETDDDGLLSALIPATEVGILWRVGVRTLENYPGLAKHWILGTFAIHANSDFEDLVNASPTAVTETFFADVVTEREAAEAAAAAAEAVGNTNDTIIASRVNDGASATRAALSTTVPDLAPFVPRANAVKYKPVLGVIRKSGGVWAAINDVGHIPTNIASVVADTAKIRVTYGFTASKVGTFGVWCDETYAAEGYFLGASVDVGHADIYIYKRAGTVGGYITYNGTSWVSTPTGMFTNFSFSAGTLTFDHAQVKPAATNLMASVSPRGVGNYDYGIGSLSSTTSRVEIYNRATTASRSAVAAPATDMRIYFSRHSDGYQAVDPTTLGEGLSNFWILGFMEK